MFIDTAINPAEIALLEKRDLSGTVCVVFDILRATSSMTTALAHGVHEIIPVRTLEEAVAMKAARPEVLLGGERKGERPEGFDLGNSPMDYLDRSGATVVWTTTNGTIALRACARAKTVLVGALLNLRTLATILREMNPDELLLVAAGTHDSLALEDVFAAGMLAHEFPGVRRSDSTRVALAVAAAYADPIDVLRRSHNGRTLVAKGRDAEVNWCARLSAYNSVGTMDGTVVRLHA